MDPLSITAAIIGISGAAITSIVSVRNTINNIQDAEKVVGDIRTQLDNIQKPLVSHDTLTITDAGTLAASKDALARSGVAEAVNDCGKACVAFDKKLQKWTKHSPDGKLSFRDKINRRCLEQREGPHLQDPRRDVPIKCTICCLECTTVSLPLTPYSRTPLTQRQHPPAETDEPVGSWLRATEPADAEPRAPSK
jgi:hypothetical protein